MMFKANNTSATHETPDKRRPSLLYHVKPIVAQPSAFSVALARLRSSLWFPESGRKLVESVWQNSLEDGSSSKKALSLKQVIYIKFDLFCENAMLMMTRMMV